MICQRIISYCYAYNGQEKDAETGLLNFELRQFDARLGRWFAPDPMGQDHTPYSAMGNNPVSMIDPTGGWWRQGSGDDPYGKAYGVQNDPSMHSEFDNNYNHGGALGGSINADGSFYSNSEQIKDAIQNRLNSVMAERYPGTDGSWAPRAKFKNSDPLQDLANRKLDKRIEGLKAALETYTEFADQAQAAYLAGGFGNYAVFVNFAGSGFSRVDYRGLKMDSLGMPYIAFTDIDNNNIATVIKFNGTNWLPVGPPVFPDDKGESAFLAFDKKWVPYVGYISPKVHIRKLTDTSNLFFSIQPHSDSVCTNNSVSFTAFLPAYSLSYQWEVDSSGVFVNLSNNSIYSGVNTATLVIHSPPITMNNKKYRCFAYNFCSRSAMSDTVTLTVKIAPTVSVTSSVNEICSGDSVTVNAGGATTYTWMPGNIVSSGHTFYPTFSTNYTATGMSSNGCTDNKYVAIIVDPLPTILISASHSVICVGDTTNLSATGANSYTWSPGNMLTNSIVVSPASTTVYTVFAIENTHMCKNVTMYSLQVNNFPLPMVTVNASQDTICLGGTGVNLNASGAGTYVWMPGNMVGAAISVNPMVTTMYTVTGTDFNSCYNDAYQKITVLSCVGINNNADGMHFSVYPNPFEEKITVQTISDGNISIEIYDSMGQLVYKEKSGERTYSINLEGENNGIYNLRVLDANNNSIYRTVLLKQR